MSEHKTIGPAQVRAMAEYGALPLAAGREAVLAPTLDAWVSDANALSRKMSAATYQDLVPATVFVHPDLEHPEG